MSSSVILGQLLRFTIKESFRRGTMNIMTKSSTMDAKALDVEELVNALQKSENHILALHVLLGSWYSGGEKSQVSIK
jgi:hypothetical protein